MALPLCRPPCSSSPPCHANAAFPRMALSLSLPVRPSVRQPPSRPLRCLTLLAPITLLSSYFQPCLVPSSVFFFSSSLSKLNEFMSLQERLPLCCLFRASLELKRARWADEDHSAPSETSERRHCVCVFVLVRLLVCSSAVWWFPRGHTGKGRERTSKHLSSSG